MLLEVKFIPYPAIEVGVPVKEDHGNNGTDRTPVPSIVTFTPCLTPPRVILEAIGRT